MQLLDEKSTAYFSRLVLDSIAYRRNHKIHRPDMINMLMEAKGMLPSEHLKTHNREWSNTELVAQCFLFFFGGFDTPANFMSFAAQELMENPDVQQKLYEEISKVTSQLQGNHLTYDLLQNMKYMDMVTSEVLRKWPISIFIDRVCNKDFHHEFDNGEKIFIKKGTAIWMPIIAMHRDEQYFENPMKFDPERFSEQNKGKITPFTYMPFGSGPRNCIG